MATTGLARLPLAPAARPTPLLVNSGAAAGGYGGFVVRAPIIGPGAAPRYFGFVCAR